jgi:hypothetical protein
MTGEKAISIRSFSWPHGRSTQETTMSKPPSTNPGMPQPGPLTATSSEGALVPANGHKAPAANADAAFTCSLIFPLGRGVHGKTFWARWLLDQLLNDGRDITVVDADRTNATLTNYFTDVVTPASAEDADVEDRLRSVTETMMEKPRITLVDFGANDLTLKRVTRKFGDFNAYLAGGGVRGVAVHFLGPDRDDLAYLRDMEEGGFAPPATILVLNEALLPPGTSTTLFEPVMRDDIFTAAMKRGARPVYMPRLETAREINRMQLGFIAAGTGKIAKDGTRFGPWNRSITNAWRRTMLANHEPVMEWLR